MRIPPKTELLEMPGLEIVRLFLEKIELLSAGERATILQTIQLLNKPIFISNQKA